MRTVFRTSEVVAEHGRGKVRHAIASGRWQRPRRGVVVTHSGPLSPDETELVALHLCAPGSALGGLTALAHDGLTGVESSRTYVVLPEGAVLPRDLGDGVTTHWSTMLDEEDVHPAREPRRTRTARSLVDAASWCGSDPFARTIVLATLQQGLTSPTHAHEALDRRGTCKRRAIIRESILDAEGGGQSLPERDFDDIRVRAGLRAPTRQTKVEGADRRYHLDATWDPEGITVEVHGAQHQDVRQWDSDLLKANEIAIGGRRQLVFTSYAVRHEGLVVERQLRRMFAAYGGRVA